MAKCILMEISGFGLREWVVHNRNLIATKVLKDRKAGERAAQGGFGEPKGGAGAGGGASGAS